MYVNSLISAYMTSLNLNLAPVKNKKFSFQILINYLFMFYHHNIRPRKSTLRNKKNCCKILQKNKAQNREEGEYKTDFFFFLYLALRYLNCKTLLFNKSIGIYESNNSFYVVNFQGF
jgi:capsule polysaccharide export protein KpsC/LpsZ